MRTALSSLSVSVLALALMDNAAALEGKKDEKSPLPGNATWELKAFNRLFRTVKTGYDDQAKQVKWIVETKEGYRTSDFVRDITAKPFTFRFLDGEMSELAIVQLNKTDFHGIPKARVMKEGTRLEITLDVPRAMPKAKRVVLERGRP